ncbi:MAG: radical SAM protein [Candidatus Peribacteraceae bacterium]|nr:radical SAM protein [Candidatus Peribacteraceae bacterium]
MNYIELKRTTFKITSRCTLKCKLCQAFIPYYKEQKDVLIHEAKLILENYFSIVDFVDTFSITGGEPLMNKDLAVILNEIFKYEDQIKSSICIITNGTLLIEEDVLNILSEHKKARVVISDYGNILSPKVNTLLDDLKVRNIQCRIDKYLGSSDDKYGGWIDYRDNSLKHTSIDAIRNQALNCFWKQGCYYEINYGELHPCARSFWRIYSGIIPKDTSQFIDLMNIDKSKKEQKAKLIQLEKLTFYNSCAYCSGNKVDIVRYKPAEQL